MPLKKPVTWKRVGPLVINELRILYHVARSYSSGASQLKTYRVTLWWADNRQDEKLEEGVEAKCLILSFLCGKFSVLSRREVWAGDTDTAENLQNKSTDRWGGGVCVLYWLIHSLVLWNYKKTPQFKYFFQSQNAALSAAFLKILSREAHSWLSTHFLGTGCQNKRDSIKSAETFGPASLPTKRNHFFFCIQSFFVLISSLDIFFFLTKASLIKFKNHFWATASKNIILPVWETSHSNVRCWPVKTAQSVIAGFQQLDIIWRRRLYLAVAGLSQ